jgi:membrane dipeptidase
MTDEMIQALAKKGGVIQINFSCGFLSQAAADASGGGGRGGRGANPELQARIQNETEGKNLTPEKRQQLIAKIRDEMGIKQVRATLADVVAHIDHVKQIAGIDAIGIGSDFDGIGCTPEGLDDVSKYPNLTRALLEKGYTAADITKIYSGNVLRVMRGVEKAAGK